MRCRTAVNIDQPTHDSRGLRYFRIWILTSLMIGVHRVCVGAENLTLHMREWRKRLILAVRLGA